MSFVQFLRILFARRLLIIGITVVTTIVAFLVSFLLPPVYDGRSRVVLDVIKPDPVTGQIIATNFLNAYTSTQIELIKDERTAGKVVDQLGWASDPTLINAYNRETGGIGIDMRQWLSQLLSKNTDAEVLQGSNILDIIYHGPNPQTARDISEMLRDAYIEQARNARRDSAAKTAKWYQEQANNMKADLDTTQAEATAYARANNVVLGNPDTDVETSKLSALANVAPAGTVSAPLPIATPATVALDQLDQQISQIATRLGPNHPDLLSLKRQREGLTQAVSREAAAMNASTPSSTMANLNSAIARQKSVVLASRDKVERVKQMELDIAIKKDQYQKAASRASELNLEAQVGDAGLTPLGAASAPSRPSWPNRPLIVFAAFSLGAALGVGLALFIELLNRRIRSHQDLEAATNAPIFTIIGDQRDPNGFISRILRFFDKKSAFDPNAEVL